MHVIIHGIRLHADVEPARFEQWVREVDYAACPDLPSVMHFAVHRAAEAGSPYDYFEVIGVSSTTAFARDMRSRVFAELEAGFSKMASVVSELAGERVGAGWPAT